MGARQRNWSSVALSLALGLAAATPARAHPQVWVTVKSQLAFTPDGSYIYVGNFSDQDFSILKVDGTEVTDTGKRFKVEGHPASARMGPR